MEETELPVVEVTAPAVAGAALVQPAVMQSQLPPEGAARVRPHPLRVLASAVRVVVEGGLLLRGASQLTVVAMGGKHLLEQTHPSILVVEAEGAEPLQELTITAAMEAPV